MKLSTCWHSTNAHTYYAMYHTKSVQFEVHILYDFLTTEQCGYDYGTLTFAPTIKLL